MSESDEEEESQKRRIAFCQPDRKNSVESFIEMLEKLDNDERLIKLELLSKNELNKIAVNLGKAIRTDAHVISRLIANRYCYRKILEKTSK